ncbi:MAG TPA: hypothetical protein VMV59_06970 [Candidatus Dormibacteraeota bacterium]|nr:hypothetical protein [Candidatus Dormibacteraeota bacterium]
MADDDVTKHNDGVLMKLDTAQKIREYAEGLGCNEKQADVFVSSLGKFFEWTGARLLFKGQGGVKTWAMDPTVAAFFKDEYSFLLPAPKAAPAEFEGKSVEIDPAVVASALAGNITAKGKVARAFGDDVEATNLFLKAESKKRDGTVAADDPHKGKTENNPWSALNWNVTRQGSVAKADFALAQRLAKAANSFIGATHPSKAA